MTRTRPSLALSMLFALPALALAQARELPLYVGKPASALKVAAAGFWGPDHLLEGDSVHVAPPETTSPETQAWDAGVTVRVSGKSGRRDALTLQWNNALQASLRLVADKPLDLRPFLPDGVVEFDLQAVDTARSGVNFAMGCANGCYRKVKYALPSRALHGTGWRHLSIPLQCFARENNDFSAVSQPFAVETGGRGEVAVANVKITASGTPNVSCTDYRVESVTPGPLEEPWSLDWWMPRHEQKLKEVRDRVAAGHAPQLVFVGDSITQGWEGDGKAVWAQHFARHEALDLGYGGDRTENVLWRLQHGELDGFQARLVVLMIGTNNTGDRQEDPLTTAAGVKRLLQEIRARQPQAQVLLLAVFPRGEQADDTLRKLNDRLNGLISAHADGRQVMFMNINQVFLRPDGSLPRDLMPDLLHPNAKGYELWARAIAPTVQALLSAQHLPQQPVVR